MAYNFQKTYTLIAQTPMIHFQHDQAGATLRATEVKPKLDKYLLQCAQKSNINQELLNSWCTPPSDKKATSYAPFRYKMQIKRMGRPTDSKITIEDCKFYFGNRGSALKKDLVFSNCELEIICFIPALMEFIQKHIASFFVLHNFGTRQTKGFGGFRIMDQADKRMQSDEEIEKAIKDSHTLYFYADIPPADQSSISKRFNHALTIYSVMKNGLNLTGYNEKRERYWHPNRYIKGFAMRSYLDEASKTLKIGSDKAFIKSKIHAPAQVDDQEKEKSDRDYPEYTFIRALLGLAERYEFRDRYRNNGTSENPNTHKISYNPVGVDVINCPANADGSPKIDAGKSISDLKKNSEIQRFASPVTIKIYQNRIYFLFNDSYKQMLGRTFLFLSFRKRGANVTYELDSRCIEQKHYLSTPKEFDMKMFIERFVSYYNTTVKGKLKFFVEDRADFENPYANSGNLTLQKGW